MANKLSITRKKRKSLSLDMKMKILNRLEEGEKLTEIAKAYGINESTVRSVRKRKENIRNSVASRTLSSLQCSSYARNPEIENTEKELMIWIDNNIQKHIPMNSLMIREKAIDIFNGLKERSSSYDKIGTFSASKGWFQNFKKRYSSFIYIDDLLEDRELNNTELNNTELINVIPETQSNNDLCTNDEEEETDSFTIKNLYKVLKLAKKLEYAVIDIDPNIERALIFRQNLMKCCSEYQEIYENLITDNIQKNNSSENKMYICNKTKDELSNISNDEND